MVNGFLNFFKEPQKAARITNEAEVKQTYSRFRLRIFYSCFVGYAVFYLCKKNIAAALPVMSAELGYSNLELGIIGSSLYLTYAFGKFINGVVADRSDVRKFLPTGLILSAIANICFALSYFVFTPGKFTFFGLPSATLLLWAFAFLWGANGWFQSMGFPPVAKSLTYWFSNSERATKWALWSTSHQTGTFLAVILSGFVIAKFGWQAAFLFPAVTAIFVALWLLNRLRDKPSSIGLPDVEDYYEPEKSAAAPPEEDNTNYIEILKKHILTNKALWALAIAYIFVYIIRFGTEDWIIKYLVEEKGNPLELASMKLSCLPLFGFFGTICAGFVSDKVFKGMRAPINIIFLSGVVLCLLGLFLNGTNANFIDTAFFTVTGHQLVDVIKINGSSLIDFLLIGFTGFFTYGPQMLIGGVCAVESSSKKVASAATGFTGTFGYIGAIFSGVGTGLVIDKFGWNGAIAFWGVSALLCAGICIGLMVNERRCKN
ncbi:MAG: MFS transporter [Heliobacteriaceae bacterium]|jgi:OPA family sugar phosphate sensor protein UhpC-like MFS transporter|nr:MFS transporter [Heliobacteriaceae bacterium]